MDGSSLAGHSLSVININGVDPVAYYAKAHSILFDFDLNYGNQYRAFNADGTHWFAPQPKTGMPGSPFPIGFSILQIPFLYAGHLWSVAATGQSDGYTTACKISYYCGVIVYLCFGMTFLFSLIRRIGLDIGVSQRRSEWVAWIVSLGLWPSTTLCYYTFSPMSHIAAFASCSAFLLAWFHAKDTDSIIRWLICGVSFGVLVLCRWQALLFIVLPFIYEICTIGSHQTETPFYTRRSWWISRLLCVGVFLITLIPQLIEWKAIYGSFIAVPQGTSFFEFPPRHVLHVLFSTQHGWLPWTPVVVLGVLGLLYGSWRLPQVWIPLLIAVVLQVCVVGSLPGAWHGVSNSFGTRMLSVTVPVIGLGVGMLLFCRIPSVTGAVAVFGALCIVYTQLACLQFSLRMVPQNDRLTFQELIVDKVFFHAAWKRTRAVNAARHELATSNAEAAIEMALDAKQRFGVDRNLLRVLVESYEKTGNSAAKTAAEKRLQQLLDSRLF